ncbi:MAG: VWA domain-containing protein, partial [Myxococcales bacterium]
FGLELWPRENPTCVTLAERVEGKLPENPPLCEIGEVTVPLGVNRGKAIQDALDPTTTRICSTTPTGTALTTAKDYLVLNNEDGREQYVVLVTDGADWDKSCPDPSPLPIVQELSAAGIKTFVVGFSAEQTTQSGVGKGFLNDMACAGQTAKGFPGTCKKVGDGYVALDSSAAAPLFLSATDGGQLAKSLQSISGSLCCDCQKSCEPPDLLFALDRTLTMHFTPAGAEPTDKADGYKTSKWAQAIAGIEKVVASPSDQYFRFGLELWPRENPTCVTLAERVEGKLPENPPLCEIGEVTVPLGVNQGKAIQDALDPTTTRICSTTPTGTALTTAKDYLVLNNEDGREQYVVLVTDGADWDKSCPDPSPL